MARPSSKIMTSADKKIAIAGLKIALKTQNETAKGLDAELRTVQKAFDAVSKAAQAEITAARKAFDAAQKAAAKTVAAAQKELDAATKKHGKFSAAAAVGTAKLNDKMSALEAAPVAEATQPPKQGKKPGNKAQKGEPALM